MASIDQARLEVQAAFAKVLSTADTAEPQAFAVVEASLWTQVLALGHALAALYLVRQAGRPRLAGYEHEGKDYEIAGSETCEVGTRFGKVRFETPVGRRVGAPRLARDLPVNRALGLCSGFSLLVVTTLTKLCAQMAFAAARKTFRDVFEWAPSQRATLRMVDALGALARPFLKQAPPPENDGEVLVVLADGKGAPSISSREYRRRAQPHRRRKSGTVRQGRRARRREQPRPRRTSGKKSKNAKIVTADLRGNRFRRESPGTGPVAPAAPLDGSGSMLFEVHRVGVPSGSWRRDRDPVAPMEGHPAPASALPGTPRPVRIGRPARVRRHDDRRPTRRRRSGSG